MAEIALVLDTTFVLPIFEIEVDTLDGYKSQFQALWTRGLKGYKLMIPSTCLLESFYKLNRETRRSKDFTLLNRFPSNLPAILNSSIVSIIVPELNPIICELAVKIRQAGHPDSLDCLIAACAVGLGGIFLTEDRDLPKILQQMSETKSTPIWNWKRIMTQFSTNP